MTIKEVLDRYHKKVPFPLTKGKIEAAGYDAEEYLRELVSKVEKCVDYDGTDFDSYY